LITFSQFSNAITTNGYQTPTQAQYNSFAKGLKTQGGITTKREAAMFLAQVCWESAGLTAKREYACKDPPYCPEHYNSNPSKGVYYYGRGYIQLVYIRVFERIL
jgi:hypothetical protein